jgi:CubicO group peptidase (beta-lactamase class C family)
MRPLLAAAALLAAVPSLCAAQDSERHRDAIAAGYKASFLCSDLFNAGVTREEAEADDLTRIYPEYREIVNRLPAVIDRKGRRVSVKFASDMPPRIAAWRPFLGCAQLPIGAGPEAVAMLPRLPIAPPRDDDDLGWPQGDAEATGPLPDRAGQALAAAMGSAFDRRSYGAGTDTTAVLVIKDGRIVGERYRKGFDLHTPQRTWSAAKSISGTLIGIAVGKGLLKVDAPAPIPEWRAPGDPRARITLANLLHMSSGLYSGRAGNRTDMAYFGGSTVTETAAAMPLEAPPGKRWRYANNDTLLSMRALRAAIGNDQTYLAFPFEELFTRIGMNRTTPETDWRGNYIMSSQVWTTARDLGRLGLLYLNDGVWDGRRILPRNWSRFVATPAPAQPQAASRTGAGYGAQFWLYGPRQGLPAGTYAAEGSRGQIMMIVPSEKLVVVRRGFDGVGQGEGQFDGARFTADVIAALHTP